VKIELFHLLKKYFDRKHFVSAAESLRKSAGFSGNGVFFPFDAGFGF